MPGNENRLKGLLKRFLTVAEKTAADGQPFRKGPAGRSGQFVRLDKKEGVC